MNEDITLQYDIKLQKHSHQGFVDVKINFKTIPTGLLYYFKSKIYNNKPKIYNNKPKIYNNNSESNKY